MSYPPDEPWLGGHGDKTHIDEGGAKALAERFEVRDVFDIGCGTGGMRAVWEGLGVRWVGIDGDPRQEPNGVKIHDLRKCQFWHVADLVWCVEVVEHLREIDIPNLMNSLCSTPVVAMTHAPPGKTGHHHVNCRDAEYWRGVFAARGYTEDPEATQLWRGSSTMRKPFVQNHGMVFRRWPWT